MFACFGRRNTGHLTSSVCLKHINLVRDPFEVTFPEVSTVISPESEIRAVIHLVFSSVSNARYLIVTGME